MLYLIFMFILSFFIIKYDKEYKDGVFEHILSLIIRFFIVLFISGAICLLTSPLYTNDEIRIVECQSIYSLKMDTKTQNDFVLFFGEVNQEKYYYYYLQLDNGNKKFKQIKATSVEINNTNEMSPQEITYRTYRKSSDFAQFFFSTIPEYDMGVHHQVLVIPKNAIQTQYDANIH